MQTALSYRTNRDLFSNHYLDEHLPDTDAWEAVAEEELWEARAGVLELWDREKDLAPDRNESQLEEKFIRPMFRELGIPFEVEESVERGARRPDYGFFESRDAANEAFKRRDEGEGFYENAVAVADAKRWGRPLDTRGDHRHDFKNPSYQIQVYLQETPTRWAVLTNGQKWRLYYGPTSHKLDSYYEIDLPTVLEEGDLEAFKYFYLFFRHDAFIEDAGGDCFLDDVFDESNVFAQALGEDLKDNIYEAIKLLSEGFLEYADNDLSEETLIERGLLSASGTTGFERERLGLIHDSSLIYLYRLIFVLYAESEGRDLLDTDNRFYEESFSLNSLKQSVAEELDSSDPGYRDWQDDLWARLDELFQLIDQGSESRGIPEEDLHIPAYNGGLFRTQPDPDDSREARFLDEYRVGDAHLSRVIELLTRSRDGNGGGKIFVDYSSLDIRHLGSVYEGLLEYKLNVAEEPLAVEEGEYVPADGEEVAVEPGEVYLTTDSGERKATGSYYTPEYVVEYIVENTLGPLVEEIRADLLESSHTGFADEFAERVFELKVLDPAMGSGHFLTNAVDYLAREIIDAQDRQVEQQGIESVDQSRDIYWARRQVAQRCVYGVDLNPLAVELSKVSLWLRTLAAEQPLAFLDHHLKTGNSLVGSDIENVLADGEDEGDAGQLTLAESFDRTRRRALEHVTDRFQALLAIDNETLADVKEMEAVFEEVRDDPLYQHLLAMANVHTADAFGLDVPADAYKRMAEALRDDSWADVEGHDWFAAAQAMAAEERFFHWELEFPVAFYGEDGERRADAGFDAVVGNPPYVSNWNLTESDPTLVEALESMYDDVAVGHWDLYIPFCKRSLDLLVQGGRHSFILSNSVSREKYARKLREQIVENYTVDSLVAFGDTKVFKGVNRMVLVYIVEKTEPISSLIAVVEGSDRSFEKIGDLPQSALSQFPDYSWRVDVTEEDIDVKNKVENAGVRLGHLCWVNPGVVAHSASDSPLKFKKDDVLTDSPGEGARKYVSGGDVGRHWINWKGKYIEYDKYYEHFHRPKDPLLFESPKIMFSDVSGAKTRIKSCFDDSGYFTNHTINHATKWTDETIEFKAPADYSIHDHVDEFDIKFIAGIVNSTLLAYYFAKFHATSSLQSDRSRMHPEEIRSLPIYDLTNQALDYVNTPELPETKDIDGERPEMLIQKLTERIIDLNITRNEQNLDLLDYLNTLSGDTGMTNIGIYRPREGVGQSVLSSTTDEVANLRIGEISTRREEPDSVVISPTARYKPQNEDEYETDRWGYTETEPIEAFTLTDLTEPEAALVEAFVPVAVEEGDGFANFRSNATKNISLLDRLKAITLPDPDDVEDDLNRYLEAKERADHLDEKIEKTDRLIDEIVYELYGLTDEEIEIVEAAVGV